MFLNRYNDCKKLQQEKKEHLSTTVFQITFSSQMEWLVKAIQRVLDEEFNENLLLGRNKELLLI